MSYKKISFFPLIYVIFSPWYDGIQYPRSYKDEILSVNSVSRGGITHSYFSR